MLVHDPLEALPFVGPPGWRFSGVEAHGGPIQRGEDHATSVIPDPIAVHHVVFAAHLRHPLYVPAGNSKALVLFDIY